MQYEIKGKDFPIVNCYLQEGESMKTQGGGMIWMSPNMKMDTNTGGGFSRMVTGESIFQNVYTAKNGDGEITFGSNFPGSICAIGVENGSYIFQKKAFIASTMDVQITAKVVGIKAGLFGGDGFIMQKFSGRGIAFVEIDGNFVTRYLEAGEQLIVNTGNVAGFEGSVKMDVQMVKGAANVLFGGEGLFLTTLTGPGQIFLQTMPISIVAGAVAPFLSSKK